MTGFDKWKEVDRGLASSPTIRRLPSYLHVVRLMAKEDIEVVSGTVIARELGLEPIQVRKDLSVTGIVGKPRVGYVVLELIDALENFLRWNIVHDAILIGPGNLGSALLGYKAFPKNGLNFVGAFDTNTDKIGKIINGVQVYSMDKLEEEVSGKDIKIAVLTVPNRYAQEAAERLVSLGITALWNFTNVRLRVPENVTVRREDLSSGYAVLSVTSGL
ncbi:redox-sensing transcriptional repressor Rex [Spirochaeta cellobiosiphila]|uniref:redox-sensing transcriptional repressor Rex n=1 Tax=Spirochaeta cellobiosiphila TaxID=504483 RepID=UPI00040B5023|nr:redox-sensing transcriptional repressor Rex [Spirochaeta cellobiosiphila]